jgi:hypothetical protein
MEGGTGAWAAAGAATGSAAGGAGAQARPRRAPVRRARTAGSRRATTPALAVRRWRRARRARPRGDGDAYGTASTGSPQRRFYPGSRLFRVDGGPGKGHAGRTFTRWRGILSPRVSAGWWRRLSARA